MKDDAVYLRHILESIRRMEANTAAGREAFLASHTLQDAVLRNLQTMAEATQRLSEAAKRARSEVEWRAISGFRNVLVHNYLGIDLDQVCGPSSIATCPLSRRPRQHCWMRSIPKFDVFTLRGPTGSQFSGFFLRRQLSRHESPSRFSSCWHVR